MNPAKQPSNIITVLLLKTPEINITTFVKDGLSILSPEELDRYHQFYFEKDRLLYLSAHFLLRRALSSYSDLLPQQWLFKRGQFGKPFIANPGYEHLHFNLSHTDGLAACAIGTTSHLGIDVERYDRVRDPVSVSTHFFTKREQKYILCDDELVQRKRFTTLWTVKESYIKLKGGGLSIPLDSFSVEVKEHNQIQIKHLDEDVELQETCIYSFKPTTIHDLTVSAYAKDQCNTEFKVKWLSHLNNNYEQSVKFV